ncbi:hypothetical protein HDU96_007208 [Phlyctochytrium bullatum]|nr:hypothetical protein HDU96_007208 [Phlyctochytrium bullatum]
MTRTRRTSYQDGITFHDRHLQRNGGDVRIRVKKDGAGPYNWGAFDEFDSDYLDYEMSPSYERKIQILDENKFKTFKEMTYASSP